MTATNDYRQTLDRAVVATREGRLDEANHLLQRATALDPSSAIPFFLLGANAAETGDVDQAESAFISCLSRDPNLAIARFQLGLLQMTNGRPAAAASTWEPLFLLDDQQPLRPFAAALIDITRGDGDSATRHIETGIRLNPGNPALNQDMRGVLSRLITSTADTGAVAANPETTIEDVDALTEHVLLSAYRQS